jgi:hypothetical protein
VKHALAVGTLCVLACARPAPEGAAATHCTGASSAGTELPSICQDAPPFAASDMAECTSKPAVVRYIAKLHDSLLATVDCPASNRKTLRAELRMRIHRDGSFEESCVVGPSQPLAVAVLAAVRRLDAAPAPSGDAACLVGAPIHLVFTVKPE